MSKIKVIEVIGEPEFEYVEKILKEAGISCYESSEDTGGAFIVMNATNPIEVCVDQKDADRAIEVLKEHDLDRDSFF